MGWQAKQKVTERVLFEALFSFCVRLELLQAVIVMKEQLGDGLKTLEELSDRGELAFEFCLAWDIVFCVFQLYFLYCAQKETHIFNVAISNELFD